MLFRLSVLAAATTTLMSASVWQLPARADDDLFAASPPAKSSNPPLFDDQNEPLFSGPLFPTQAETDAAQTKISASRKADKTIEDLESRMEDKINRAQIQQEMRGQMQQCANWLERYGIRNRGEFPGVGGNDEMFAAQVQLSELVPNNPYAWGYTTQPKGFQGVPAYYNPDGSPQTGSPVWGDSWTQHLQAQQNNRVQLSMDYSLTRPEIDQWTTDPPDTWNAAPGTISCIGNNQGLFVIWGADETGRPIKDIHTGRYMLIAGSCTATVNDQAAPNEK